MSLVTPARVQPRAARASSGPFASCSGLGPGRVGQPRRQRRVVVGVQGGRVEPRASAPSAVATASAVTSPVPRPQVPSTASPGARAAAGVRGEPGRPPRPAPGCSSVDRRSPRRPRARPPPASGRAGRAAPGTAACRTPGARRRGPTVRTREVRRADRQRHVADQLGERRLRTHRREVLAQRVARLARDLVDAVDQRGRASRTHGPTSPRSSPPRRGCSGGCRWGRRAAPRSRGTARASARSAPRPRPGR